MDQIIPQDIEMFRSNNRCSKTSTGYNEDGRINEYDNHRNRGNNPYVINFIQLVSLQPVDQFSQTKLHWKALNEGYMHMYNRQSKYQVISSCKIFVC